MVEKINVPNKILLIDINDSLDKEVILLLETRMLNLYEKRSNDVITRKPIKASK